MKSLKLTKKFVILALSITLIILMLALADESVELEAFLTVGLIFSSFGIIIYFAIDRFIQKNKVQELKEASLLAEVDSLKTQINPHFFFNTLNNLYSLIVKKSPNAPEMVLKLSDIMRYTIYEGAKERVILKDEIQYLENYLELQKIRFKRKLDLKFEKSVVNEDIDIPPLLFIVLVENAFKHGAESLTEKPFIYIKLIVTAQDIDFDIQNNCDTIKAPGNGGIGLKNLKRRLELIYPDNHHLTIEEPNHGIFHARLRVTIL